MENKSVESWKETRLCLSYERTDKQIFSSTVKLNRIWNLEMDLKFFLAQNHKSSEPVLSGW